MVLLGLLHVRRRTERRWSRPAGARGLSSSRTADGEGGVLPLLALSSGEATAPPARTRTARSPCSTSPWQQPPGAARPSCSLAFAIVARAQPWFVTQRVLQSK